MGRPKKEEGTTHSSKLEAAIEKLNKEYGTGTVLTLDNGVNDNYEVIPTGSIGFDYITLGTGGFVKGKLYELRGWESSGKSTICGHATAQAQKKGWKVAYIDGEHAVDKSYFEAIGVDTKEMLLCQPSYGEEGFNVAMELIETGEIDLVIIDSDSSLIPKKVIDGDVGDSAIGKKAMLNSNAYPKLKGALSKHNVCVIVISQYREKIGMMFGDPKTTQGGHALKFYSDCIVEVSKSLVKEGDVVIGNLTKVKCIKSKMSPPFRIHQFEIVFGEGIGRYGEILDMAVEAGIIVKAGSWFSYQENKVSQGRDAAIQFLKDNPEVAQEIEQKIINNIKNLIKIEEE